MKLTLGFSPCPNDTFIFDWLVNKKMDTEGVEFDVVLEDVETLNQWALQGKLDITKLSFPAFFQSTHNYVLLDAGSALGVGVGPLLVSKAEVDHLQLAVGKDEPAIEGPWHLDKQLVALPGANTTANLLFSFAYPAATNKKFMIFSAIEDAVVNGEADMGVIIHENRFTYQQKGLHKVTDLGEYWEEKMKAPIPLGGIAIKRSIDKEVSTKVNRLIKQSLQHAFTQYPTVTDYVRQHSQAMNEEVMRQHINLYVNNFSLSLGKEGRDAIKVLYKVYSNNQAVKAPTDDLFL
jgi:1,4-dihydroxy-6-naphthoate synthase